MTSSTKWKWVASLDDLKPGVPVRAELNGKDILLVRDGDEIRAAGGSCPHYGAPLHEGHIHHGSIVCPWHHARFDLKTGSLKAPPALDPIAVWQIKVENQEVYAGKKTKPSLPEPVIRIPDHYVILGGGAAGNAAAETLRREKFEGRVTMITREADYPYDRTMLSKAWLSGDADPDYIPLRDPSFYADYGIDVLLKHRITRLDPAEKVLYTEEGKPVNYDKCLIATGGRPRLLDVPGKDLNRIFTLRSWADARNIQAALHGAEEICIVGAGFIGMEAAASLRARNMTVHVAAPEAVPLEGVFGERIGSTLKQLHETSGIIMHTGTRVESFRGTDRVTSVFLSDGSELPVDMVIMGLGVDPALEFLEGTGMDISSGLAVNDLMQTSYPDIYAAGDAAIVPYGFSGLPHRIEHWAAAESQGMHAARAMMGRPESYAEVPFFWTRLFGKSYKMIGFAPDHDRIEIAGNVEEGAFLAGYFKNDRLLAAAALEMDEVLAQLEDMLRHNVSVNYENFKRIVS